MELLAPAGTEAAFHAALHNGADAIYLGAGPHHARQFSGGFTEPVFFSLVDEAHAAGVRVYLTLNTLLNGQELPQAADWAARAWYGGTDAIIVQDIGLARVLRQRYPDMVLHASTQMSIHNAEGVLAAKTAGLSRVVLARELSLADIAEIREKADMELEVFGHGALCVSYSGQCLMSSLIGGRSGNRGTCAQPCRLPWKLRTTENGETANGYLLSMKDLMTLPLLPQLAAAGVTALKIEGRMKSPEYVAHVTGMYRKYLDLLAEAGPQAYAVDPADERLLAQIFNRGGFTRRYLTGNRSAQESAGDNASRDEAVWGALVDPLHPKNRGVRVGTVTAWRAPYATVELTERVALGDGIEIHRGGVGGEQAVSMMLTAIVSEYGHQRDALSGQVVRLGDVREPIREGDAVYRTSQKELTAAAADKITHWQVHRVPVQMDVTLKIGEPAVLTLRDRQGREAVVLSDIPVEAARQRALSVERLADQLFKTGDTPWAPEIGRMVIDEGATLPISAINAMRRDALGLIRDARIASVKPTPASATPHLEESISRSPLFCGSSRVTLAFARPPSVEWLAAAQLNGYADRMRIMMPAVPLKMLAELKQAYGGPFWISTPAIVPQQRMDALAARISPLLGDVDGLAAGNPGTLRMLRRLAPDVPIFADYGMNVWNAEAIRQAADWGADQVLLSPELPPEAAAALSDARIPITDWAYGRVQVMTTSHCPGSLAGPCDRLCARCPRREGVLTDRAGAMFPWFRDPFTETTALFHCHPLRRNAAMWHPDTSCLHMMVTDETPEVVAMLLADMASSLPLLQHPSF